MPSAPYSVTASVPVVERLCQAARSLPRLLFSDDGLPPASAAGRRGSFWLTTLACVWFLAVGLWEIASPFGAGHYAASCAVALAGENMPRFSTLLPITHHVSGVPSVADCYCHHPFGIFWTSALFSALFGHHDWVCRLPAVLLSALTPALLSALGRSLWSPEAGAIAALSFVFTPIALAFANFNALEVPVIFGTVLACIGYVRLRQSGRRRYLWLTLAALAYSLNADWAAFVFGGALLTLALVRGVVFARALPRVEAERVRAFLAWGALLCATLGLAYAGVLHGIGKLDDLLDQGRSRSAGAQAPWSETLAARRYWLWLMFTPLGIAVAKAGAMSMAVRALAFRSDLEAVPLLLLGMASFQYFVFKQGADVHIFWPHYFAPCLALGVAALVHSAQQLSEAWLRRSDPSAQSWAQRVRVAIFACGVLVPLLMARDALATLVYGRKTGGRFNEGGRFMQPDKDKVAALAWLGRHSRSESLVGLSPNMRQSLWVPWVLGRPVQTTRTPFAGGEATYVTDGRFERASKLQYLATHARVMVIGPFWVVERGPAGGLQALGIERREPVGAARFLVSANHALHEVVPDLFWQWELRHHFGSAPNPFPAAQPRSPEALRIAHNSALSRGDEAQALELRLRLLQRFDTHATAHYMDGTRLLGTRLERGSSDVLTVLFEAGAASEQRFVIHARVEQAMSASWVPADTLVRELGSPPSIPRGAWRLGYLYSSVTELIVRPGTESFFGSWVALGALPPAVARDGARPILLLRTQ